MDIEELITINEDYENALNVDSIARITQDVILYNGNQITIYYDTNNWDFTLLGRIQGKSQSELKNILGDGDVTVVFSLRNK